MKYRGIIFDFNGVLLWDTEWHEETWQSIAVERLGRQISNEEFDHLHGHSNADFADYFLGKNANLHESKAFGEKKEEQYRQLALSKGDQFALSPGAVELLDALKDKKIPRAIATSSPKSNMDFFVEHLNLYEWFDRSNIICVRGTIRGKPAPDLYLAAARSMGVPLIDCVVIEDTRTGIASAQAASVGHIIAIGPKSTHGILKRINGVSEVVETLDEVKVKKLFH